ncbi:DNA adenine methylase [Faecalispora jeddahensis]|uniref:DNA adenine methylase n=1 Tax=Faecalispora jeddahensis TaxID=1414721 RepID=UPI0004B0AE2D|nr:DNA adenine methylase [Faecalispora jeddahensis]
MNFSPLRYPGGKSRLAGFIKLAIQNSGIKNGTYIEPFAGGAGVALSLLMEGSVENIVINDYDKAIYSFWRAVKEEPKALIERIETTPINIEEWRRQKDIYCNSSSYSVDLAFATLFLNRTNRSGILTAGPIGGYAQDGDWKLDVRFNRNAVCEKIEKIAAYRQNIYVYNKDILSLLEKFIPQFGDNVFIYFDPPYYNKGQKLYKNFFSPSDHKRIRDAIAEKIMVPWIITYDDIKAIQELYEGYSVKRFDLTYSAANKGVASELMVFSDIAFCPTPEQLANQKININLRE